jgi:hypothetical protein
MNFSTSSWNLDVDNVGLWEYLIDPASGADKCHSNQFSGQGRELTDQLINQRLSGGGNATPVFDIDIVGSPRFAVVPVLHYVPG